MSTLLAIVVSILLLFLLGFFNYYIPASEKLIAEDYARSNRAGDCVIISNLHFGVSMYVIVSFLLLVATVYVYSVYDYDSFGLYDSNVIIEILIIILHVFAIFCLACIYTFTSFLGELFSEWKTIVYYEEKGVRVLDSREEDTD